MLDLKALNLTSIVPFTKTNSPLIFSSEVIAPPKSIYTFEILRFVAAFVTFFGHYCHFFDWQNIDYSKNWFGNINPDIGSLAVPIFFLLSGAIFSHTYGNSIASKETTFWTFAKRRFARLYPLHILTLLLVIVLQTFVFLFHRQYFIYQLNDIEHFLMQIFFISNWTLFEGGPSFNGPIWSVSHEVFLYLCFFLFFYLASKVKAKNFFIICCYLAIIFVNPGKFVHDSTGPLRYSYVIKSLFTFMSGVFVYQVYRFILRYNLKSQFITSVLFLLFLYSMSSQFEAYGIPYGWWAPATIFVLLLFNTYFKLDSYPKFRSSLFELGSLTYSSYLLHFPIQLMMLTISDHVLKIDFNNKFVFLSYLSLVLVISYFVNKHFEVPMKKLILRKRS